MYITTYGIFTGQFIQFFNIGNRITFFTIYGDQFTFSCTASVETRFPLAPRHGAQRISTGKVGFPLNQYIQFSPVELSVLESVLTVLTPRWRPPRSCKNRGNVRQEGEGVAWPEVSTPALFPRRELVALVLMVKNGQGRDAGVGRGKDGRCGRFYVVTAEVEPEEGACPEP